MKLSDLPDTSRTAIERAMFYWEQHWDWECPLLFGIDLQQLQASRSEGITRESDSSEVVATAALGSLRELLHGASAIPKNAVPGTIGLSYEAASDLCKEVWLCVESSFGSGGVGAPTDIT